MKCYTIKNNKISEGIDTEGLPCDKTLKNVKNAKNLMVVAGMPERDGIYPEEVFNDNLENATACCRIVFSVSEEDTDGRFLVAYDPREWIPDKAAGCSSALVFRSRSVFIAVSMDNASFKMKSLKGDSEIVVEKGLPKIIEGYMSYEELPEPEEGWFLAKMQ